MSFLRALLLSSAPLASAAPVLDVRWSASNEGGVDWATYKLDGLRYLVPLESAFATLPSFAAESQAKKAGRFALVPYTTISTNRTSIDAQVVGDTLDMFADVDDVWSPGFLGSVLLIGTSGSKATLTADACSLLASHGTKLLVSAGVADTSACSALETSSVSYPSHTVPQGPYVGVAGIASGTVDLFQVYRLYVDTHSAFVNGVYSTSSDSWRAFELYEQANSLIPVPSRLYSLNDIRPLAGWRFGIKDLFDVQGIVTAAGDRQFGSYYGVANSTCYAVQRLLDLGAVPIGKTKSAPYASGEEGQEWLSYQYPSNARADGFQTCSASSSGSGCAIGAYDWLDFAIGTDTGESVRRPAAVNGIYGNRPTQGMLSVEGVIPLTVYEDTVGLMTRSPYRFETLIKHWYATTNLTLLDATAFPRRLLYPTDYFLGSTAAFRAVVDNWLANVTSAFSMDRVDVNLTEVIFAANASFSNSSNLLNGQLQYQADNLLREYIDVYRAQNGGRYPALSPARRPRVDQLYATDTVGNETYYADALRPKLALVDFIETEIFRADATTCSDSILVYDIGYGGRPYYRQDMKPNLNKRVIVSGGRGADPPPVTPTSSLARPRTPLCGSLLSVLASTRLADVRQNNISPATTTPDYVVPIGEVSFVSNITRIEETLPVTVRETYRECVLTACQLDLVSRPGCDFMLVNFIRALADQGLLRAVKTGRTLF